MAIRSRLSALGAVLLVLQAAPAFAQDAKASLAAADKSARAKDWTKALADYRASNQATPSADAQEGIANASYELKEDADAYAAYEELLKTWGTKIPPYKKTTADARMKEISARTGLLTLEIGEAGASITIDDKPAGTSPLAKPLRLSQGPHRVRITKDGFVPFDQVPAVPGAGAVTVTAKLEAASTKGKVVVKEKTGQAMRVLVDGVDVGDAPWTGELEAGPHEIGARSPTLSAVPQRVVVERGKTQSYEVVGSASTAPLKVSINDGQGLIYLDDKIVGDGSFSDQVPSGPHKIRVKREGYETFEVEVVLKEKEPFLQSVTLKLNSAVRTGPIVADTGRLEGIYGGFGLLLTALPGGMKGSMQKLCTASDRPAELAGCEEGGGIGGGLTGFIGYHWDPIGIELFAAGQYDQASPKLDWNASSTDPGLGPDPARTEEFSLHRAGGLAAFRIRYTVQGEKFRFSAAGGVGLSLRTMVLTRDTNEKAPGSGRNAFVPDAQSYVSPVLSLEPSVQYRLSKGLAVALGASLLVESPSAFNSIPTTKADGSQLLAATGSAKGLTTPAYELATSTQIFLGPFIGLMFGP